MWGIPLGLLLRLAAVAALAIALLVAKHKYDSYQQDLGAARVQAAWDADKARRMAQVAEINQERVDAVARADSLARAQQEARSQSFADVRRSLPAGPADAALARRLLDDAVRAANGQAPASPGEPAGDTAAAAELTCDFGPWVRWGEQVAELYAQAREQVVGWQAFYADLRK